MTGIVYYGLAAALLVLSFIKDREKTFKALKKAVKAFWNILPQFLGIIAFVGILLAVLDPQTINRILGKSSGIAGVLIASIVGSITLIPGFIAFPTAALLLKGGVAGYMQVGAFVSSLMMVGVVTLPAEIGYFNRRMALLRNTLAYVFSLLVALIIGLVMAV
ncbi:MAG: permease [Spirochaetota bacterium]